MAEVVDRAVIPHRVAEVDLAEIRRPRTMLRVAGAEVVDHTLAAVVAVAVRIPAVAVAAITEARADKLFESIYSSLRPALRTSSLGRPFLLCGGNRQQ